jgi:uncharacterized protein YodC (DUF2158 family)
MKPGDVVRFKTGGPLMTVARESKDVPGIWQCQWFESANLLDGWFGEAVLESVGKEYLSKGFVELKTGVPNDFGVPLKVPAENTCIVEFKTGDWSIWPAVTNQEQIVSLVVLNLCYHRNVKAIWMHPEDLSAYNRSVFDKGRIVIDSPLISQ